MLTCLSIDCGIYVDLLQAENAIDTVILGFLDGIIR